MARVHHATGRHVVALDRDWTCALTPPGAAATPADADRLPGWIPAPVPGTAAQALRDAGLWSLDAPTPLHDRDVWYRVPLPGEGTRTLRLRGLATIAELWLDGEPILSSDNMFHAHALPVRLTGASTLHIAFRALEPVLKRQRGRGRWRPTMIASPGMRAVRATLLGHMPGWCPPVHAVGPWRGVELVEETGPLTVHAADLRTGLVEDGTAVLDLSLSVAWTGGGPPPPGRVSVAGIEAPLAWTDPHTLAGRLRAPGLAPWWPHTHGEPALHAIAATVGDTAIDLGRTGFRRIERDPGDGFALRVNGVPIFARGACWSSPDIVALPGTRDAYVSWLALARDAGMNMIRVGGTMLYEDDAFFELCDELGILIWQDFAFANFDYPTDELFTASVRREAAQLLDRTQSSPSLAVLCGGSEAEQQAAMLGLPAEAWSQPLFDTVLREESARTRPDVPYVTNSPTGGALPFAADAGVAHYYGVGAYRRPLEDARRAGVRFASECLAFANLPDAETLRGVPPVHHPRWKERVPRDLGAPWDFEDIRDHYLARLFGVDPTALRAEDPDRYRRLSRAVTAEAMEASFAEWRRVGSTCAGGLVWLFQDLWPGAGWGVVGADGVPKAAWHALKRAFRPVQVLLTDEGVNGLAVHLINETPRPVAATLSFACLARGERAVAQAERAVELLPRSAQAIPAAALLGRFFDTTRAYRFGPPEHDATVATLTDAATGDRLADAFHFPDGSTPERADLGLSAEPVPDGDGWALVLRSRRLARSVHLDDDGFRMADEWFHLPPGAERRVRLLPRHGGATRPDGELHALNAYGPVRVR
ncbi:glycoside hydrolase family 2 protein [Azospirillum sp. RWY-5-1]|uniref:Glycoside hydrolase family 2 protein n=2 Tax=Azospirillum oleiclasticum TaxID=2735135 RepID=A0ABX2T6R1_9PROT|nr:glycoside hydrolase family 2 protein [Azospirillum oleiclasticum]NYZ12592.1 glycoside hydrolase family 2 protein [Azospirillum oleiclasticum]NYZ19752.1 glycoside hydrolase family 2 protein [Azospirillum oleiclasticum]